VKSRLRVVGRMRDDTGTHAGGLLILIGMAFAGATAVAALPRQGALV